MVGSGGINVKTVQDCLMQFGGRVQIIEILGPPLVDQG